MKIEQTMHAITAYANGLGAAEAHSAAADLRFVASFLDEFHDEQMSILVKRGSKVGIQGTTAPYITGTSPSTVIASHIDLLGKILVAGGANAEATKDLVSFSKLLRGFDESETLSAVLDKLRDAMKPEPVEQQISAFIERLKKARGTASFDQTFAELAASPLLREHVVAVALSVYGGIKMSTSRKAALGFIRKPHDAQMSAKRGIEATAGRSAA